MPLIIDKDEVIETFDPQTRERRTIKVWAPIEDMTPLSFLILTRRTVVLAKALNEESETPATVIVSDDGE
jgi:hypothetical protein